MQNLCTHLPVLPGLRCVALWGILVTTAVAQDGQSRTIRVPADQPTIQQGIDAARDGDTVLVAPGVYRENLQLKGKTITLASEYLRSQNDADIARTVIDGQGKDFVIQIAKDVGPETTIIGFTIQNGDDGLACRGKIRLLHNRITATTDGIDSEGGGGLIAHNVFENNRDDAVDLDSSSAAIVEHNILRNNRDDGIEIRLHEYSGPVLNIVIRENLILGNGEDGIQIIDYPDRSDRVIRIERNVIAKSAMSGIGCMSDGNTKENFEGADIPERIYIINNTLVENQYGITGGDNAIVLNNIFLKTAKSALRKVDGGSVAAFNLFWNNGTDVDQSRVEGDGTVLENPQLDEQFRPTRQSPAIDRGTAKFQWKGETVLELPAEAYVGSAPDLGAKEFDPSEK